MPFVELLFESALDESIVVALRDSLHDAVGPAFEAVDPEHTVTKDMVDVRCIATGSLDRIRPEVIVTVLARSEPARQSNRGEIANRLTQVARAAAPGLDLMLEVVLTNRTSTYIYP